MLTNYEFHSNSEIPISLSHFLKRMGISTTTGWRWRKEGWLKATNIAGRHYIRAEDLRQFNERAKNGDFSKKIEKLKSPFHSEDQI
jgi:hypothetical protein